MSGEGARAAVAAGSDDGASEPAGGCTGAGSSKSERARASKLYRKTATYKAYLQRRKGSARYRWGVLRSQARRRGIPVRLERLEFFALVLKPCADCGAFEPGTLRGLDRVDNDGAYTMDNCVACCAPCNFAKGHLPVHSFLAHVKRVSCHTPAVGAAGVASPSHEAHIEASASAPRAKNQV